MSAEWKPGDKAVCIAESWKSENYINENTPKKGVIYLVKGTLMDSKGYLGLFLAGSRTWMRMMVFGIVPTKGKEVGWHHEGFRKVVTTTEREAIEQKAKL